MFKKTNLVPPSGLVKGKEKYLFLTNAINEEVKNALAAANKISIEKIF